jgi:branched-subunit amino acid aminotransferase/4-amino-4-deoxychorismate lyase
LFTFGKMDFNMQFLISNGEIIDKDELKPHFLFTDNRFHFSQKIWYGYGNIPFFSENIEQITEQIKMLGLPSPGEFENRRELLRLTKRMLNRNKFFRSGYIHFQLFWNRNKPDTLITANAFREFDFPFSENGVLAIFSRQKKDSQNSFCRFPFYNKALWQAGFAEDHHYPFQQLIFLNEKNFVCESAHTNIFMVKEDELLTPSLSTGCYEDVLRTSVLEIARQTGMIVTESETIDIQHLYEMDEIFLASEELGFQWILGIENRRFLHQFAPLIHKELCNSIKNP